MYVYFWFSLTPTSVIIICFTLNSIFYDRILCFFLTIIIFPVKWFFYFVDICLYMVFSLDTLNNLFVTVLISLFILLNAIIDLWSHGMKLVHILVCLTFFSIFVLLSPELVEKIDSHGLCVYVLGDEFLSSYVQKEFTCTL